LQPFAIKSHGLHYNAQQRSMSTKQCKFLSVGLIVFEKEPEVDRFITLHVNLQPLTAEDLLLIKTLQW